MAEFNIPENLSAMFENLEKIFTSKTVFGDAVTFGETTLIPIMEISFGMGTGGGTGEDKKMSGGGSGVGVKMTPTAVIAITGDGVEVLPMKKTPGMINIAEMIPEIISRFRNRKKEDKVEEK